MAGLTGSIYASPVLGIGNAIFFNDSYSPEDWGRDMLIGGVGGAVVGGVASALKATPGNYWTGLPVRNGNPWSFSNRALNVKAGPIILPSTEYGEVFDDAGNVFERVNKPGSVQYNLDGAAKGGSTALRPVGSVLESIEDIMTNPSLLKGQSYGYIRNMVGDSKNWVNDIMRRSTRADGWVLREMNQAGNDFTGRMIQYHPGTPRHFGGAPYWKVSSGSTIFRIPLDLMFFEITVKGKDI